MHDCSVWQSADQWTAGSLDSMLGSLHCTHFVSNHTVYCFTSVKPTASRHAVTCGLAALAYGSHVECNVIISNTAYSNVRVSAVKIF